VNYFSQWGGAIFRGSALLLLQEELRQFVEIRRRDV
jgi:hypothetical protein